MTDSLRGSTTIVTEHRTYLIDRTGRRGAGRASVSAKSKQVSQIEVEVTKTQPYLIAKHSNKFLQISTAFPVIATFIPGTPEVGEPTQPADSYTTGILYVDPTIKAGTRLQVSLYDPDLAVDKVQVTVFNATTGETEFLTLCRLENGLFRNTIAVQLSMYRGNDFDGVMYASPNDTVRIIYNDGRGQGGEPVKVVANTVVTSDFKAPVMVSRRVVRPDGILGMRITASTEETTRTVSCTNIRTGQVSTLTAVSATGIWDFSISVSTLAAIEGDSIQIEHTYTDLYGAPVVIARVCAVSVDDVQGIMTAPLTVVPTESWTVTLDDPDLSADYVDIVLAGDQSNKFLRIRCDRQGPYTGVYTGSYDMDSFFDDDTSMTLTYADSSAGVPKLVRQHMVIDRALPVIPDAPTGEQPGGNFVEQLALQMEINGLFTLNGQFSGVIKLRAKENETVRCSITQAS